MGWETSVAVQAGSTVTGMPLSTALPDSGSSARLVGQEVGVHPGVRRRRRAARAPGRSWPQPCGQADHAGPDRVGDLDRRRDRAHPRARPGPASPSARPRRAASSGCTWSGAAVLALHQHLDVVHPRVVGAQVAAADQHQRPPVARGRSSAARRRAQIVDDEPRGQLDLARRRCAARRAAAAPAAPRSMPCGWSARRVEATGRRDRRRSRRRTGPVRSMRSSTRSRRRGAASSAAQLVGVAPAIGEPASRRRAPGSTPSIIRSSTTAGSASAPWPAAIRARRARISHSSGCPSARASGGGASWRTLRTASWRSARS